MEKAAKEMELIVNENKTKFMPLNEPACSNLMNNRISLNYIILKLWQNLYIWELS
jgi:hypothetical protein